MSSSSARSKWCLLPLISIMICEKFCFNAFQSSTWRGRRMHSAVTAAKLSMSSDTKSSLVKKQKAKNDSKDFPVLQLDPEDTGLKVNPTAWKWPIGWPYGGDYFDRQNTEADSDFYRIASASMSNEKIFDDDAIERLHLHLRRFIPDGADVLELGAGAHSYIPSGLIRSRHVGIGLNKSEMDSNQDLKEPPIEQDLNAHPTLDIPDESFDIVLISNSVEFFTDPRVIFREINRVLRPGGRCIVCFTGKDAYKPLHAKQIKMWRDMNDAQHMWVIGSYFHFSSAENWSDLKGYDLTPSSSQGIMATLSGGKSSVYVVQAKKVVDSGDPMTKIRQWLRQCPSIEADEYDMCALRLMAEYNQAATPIEKNAAIEAAKRIPEIYDVLSQLKKGVLFPPYKALLAVRLAMNGWKGSDAQKAALREGLGMVEPGQLFWAPLGKLTMQMDPEDKVLLLSEFVPLFGSDLEQSVIPKVIPVLESVLNTVELALRTSEPGDVQLLSTDLIVTDFVNAPSNRDSFLTWLESVSPEDIRQWLNERKNYKEAAKNAASAKKEDNIDTEPKLQV